MKNTKEKSKLFLFFSKNFFNVGTIIGVIAIIIMIYISLEAKSERELKYYCHPVKATVVKAGQTSSLEVFCDKEKIESNVKAVQVAIWNNGKESIKRDDILETITLYTEPKTPIIDAVVRKQSREVINLSIDRSSFKEGFIPINWQILEHNDGGIIQVIFAGKPDVEILAKGTIEGQKSIKQVKYSRKIQTPEEQIKSDLFDARFAAFGLLFVVIVQIFFVFLSKRYVKKKRAKYKKKMTEEDFKEFENMFIKKYKISGLLMGMDKVFWIAAIVFFALFIITMLMLKLKGPPFGF